MEDKFVTIVTIILPLVKIHILVLEPSYYYLNVESWLN
jgi:hypothetical protein